jgi:hypothetical protein
MNKNISFAALVAISSILLICVPNPLSAQGISVIGARPKDPNAVHRPEVLINREPIPTLDFKMELVEILPGGINVLSPGDPAPSWLGIIPGFHSGWRVGGNGLESIGSNLGLNLMVGTELLQLDQNGIILGLTVTDSRTKVVLASQKLSLQNYQEAFVEFAAATAGNRRLALRLLPTVKYIPPLQDCPSPVQSLHLRDGLLILNTKEMLWRGGFGFGSDDSSGNELLFLTITGRAGLLVISDHPFPGASLQGYFQDRKLIFKWNEDVYELLTQDGPILPEGKWAAYVWQADPTPRDKSGMSGFVATIQGIPENINRLLKYEHQKLEAVK